MNLGHHLCIEKLFIVLTLYLLVERKSSMQILSITPSIGILIELFVGKPFSPLTSS